MICQRMIMSQGSTPEAMTPAQPSPQNDTELVIVRDNVTRRNRRNTSFIPPARDFEDTTPKICGVLGLRSENITNKLRMMIS